MTERVAASDSSPEVGVYYHHQSLSLGRLNFVATQKEPATDQQYSHYNDPAIEVQFAYGLLKLSR